MMDLKELLAKAKTLLAEMTELRGKVDTAEKDEDRQKFKTLFEAKEAEMSSTKDKIDAKKAEIERMKYVEEVEKFANSNVETKKPGEEDAQGKAGAQLGQQIDAQAKDGAEKAKEEFKAFCAFMDGKSISGNQRELIRPKSPKLKSADGAVIPREIAAAVLGDPIQGKVMASDNAADASLIPPEWKKELLDDGRPALSILNDVAIMPVETGMDVTWPAIVNDDTNEFGGVVVQRIGEGAEKPESEPNFEERAFSCFELAAHTVTTIRFENRSAFNIASILANLFRPAIYYTLEGEIFNGRGAALREMTGILNTVGVRTVQRTTAGTVVDDDVVNLKHEVRSHHRAGSKFWIHDTVERAFELQKDNEGRPLFTASIANGPYDRLRGFPYSPNYQQPTIGNSGDIVYGRGRAYFVGMEQDVVIEKSKHFKFTENKNVYRVSLVAGGRLMYVRMMAKLADES